MAHESVITVESPDGQLHIEVMLDAGASLRYRVYRGAGSDAETAVRSSPLTIRFIEASFTDGLSVTGVTDVERVTFGFSLPHGKRRVASAEANRSSVTIANGAGDELTLDLVAFDDGVAHRFCTPAGTSRTLVGDDSGFVFDLAGRKFAQVYDAVSLHAPASESLFHGALNIGAEFPTLPGWCFPALFHTGENWTLLTESAVGGTSQGSHLDNGIHPGEYVLRGPSPEEGEGPTRSDAVSGPWSLPWKVIITSTDAGDIISSDVAAMLAPETTLTDLSWIRPGRVSWSWWSDSDSPTDPTKLRHFIDLAAAMGWEYSLIDANWNTMPGGTIESLVAYASERNVGLFLWYNSGGPHNVVTEEPRGRMHERERRRSEMEWLKGLGVVGLKVDFFQSNKASMNQLALDMLADAADFQLMMNFHGITEPKAWHRTWPHLMTTEAVRGAEQYKFDRRYPATAARHHTVLPFTRNAVAPMDYTPVTLSDVDYPHLTTFGHELALGVLFESSLQHPADKPEAYLALPDPAQDYLRRLPSVWDDVVVLCAVPGDHVVLARRHENQWWLAAINGTDQPLTVDVDLTRLALAAPLQVGLDGDSDRTLTFASIEGVATITMRPFGGAFAWPASNDVSPG